MFSFIKGIFKSSDKPLKGPDEYELFFDTEKKVSVIIRIKEHQTMQEVYTLNHNLIIETLLSNHSMNDINTSEFSFVVINKNNSNSTFIKLKDRDIPFKYLNNAAQTTKFNNISSNSNVNVNNNFNGSKYTRSDSFYSNYDVFSEKETSISNYSSYAFSKSILNYINSNTRKESINNCINTIDSSSTKKKEFNENRNNEGVSNISLRNYKQSSFSSQNSFSQSFFNNINNNSNNNNIHNSLYYINTSLLIKKANGKNKINSRKQSQLSKEEQQVVNNSSIINKQKQSTNNENSITNNINNNTNNNTNNKTNTTNQINKQISSSTSLSTISASTKTFQNQANETPLNNNAITNINYNNNNNNNIIYSHIITEKEAIREGELLKFSFSANKFDRRHVTLDKDKLIVKKLKDNECHVIWFSEVDYITIENIDSKIKSKSSSKYMFQIRMKDSEQFVFSSKSLNDLEAWYDSILQVFSICFENDKINRLEDGIMSETSSIYNYELKLINCLFSLSGVFAVNEFKAMFLTFCDELYEVWVNNNISSNDNKDTCNKNLKNINDNESNLSIIDNNYNYNSHCNINTSNNINLNNDGNQLGGGSGYNIKSAMKHSSSKLIKSASSYANNRTNSFLEAIQEDDINTTHNNGNDYEKIINTLNIPNDLLRKLTSTMEEASPTTNILPIFKDSKSTLNSLYVNNFNLNHKNQYNISNSTEQINTNLELDKEKQEFVELYGNNNNRYYSNLNNNRNEAYLSTPKNKNKNKNNTVTLTSSMIKDKNNNKTSCNKNISQYMNYKNHKNAILDVLSKITEYKQLSTKFLGLNKKEYYNTKKESKYEELYESITLLIMNIIKENEYEKVVDTSKAVNDADFRLNSDKKENKDGKDVVGRSIYKNKSFNYKSFGNSNNNNYCFSSFIKHRGSDGNLSIGNFSLNNNNVNNTNTNNLNTNTNNNDSYYDNTSSNTNTTNNNNNNSILKLSKFNTRDSIKLSSKHLRLISKTVELITTIKLKKNSSSNINNNNNNDSNNKTNNINSSTKERSTVITSTSNSDSFASTPKSLVNKNSNSSITLFKVSSSQLKECLKPELFDEFYSKLLKYFFSYAFDCYYDILIQMTFSNNVINFSNLRELELKSNRSNSKSNKKDNKDTKNNKYEIINDDSDFDLDNENINSSKRHSFHYYKRDTSISHYENNNSNGNNDKNNTIINTNTSTIGSRYYLKCKDVDRIACEMLKTIYTKVMLNKNKKVNDWFLQLDSLYGLNKQDYI